MNSAKRSVETVPTDVAERVRAIRFRLPGQAVGDRIEIARVAYGALYTMGLIRERVGCVDVFMQLVGTRAGGRRAGHAGAPGLGDPR